jgi:glycosyltransferase involved in cell wall biosynthesis
MEKRKLTICFFGDARTADIFTLRWARYFSERGHKIHLFSYFPFDEENQRSDIELHIIEKKFPNASWLTNTFANLPLNLMKIRKEIKKIKPDIIHAQCVTSYGKLAGFLYFHPLVITAWGSDILINPHESLTAKIGTKYVLKKADLITCDAEHMKEAMIKLGANPSKIKIINFGIDTQKFCPGEESKELRNKLGTLGLLTVISLRRLEPIYNIETLIRAIPLVLKEVPETRFIIAGTGSQEKQLKNLSRTLKIDEKVEFIGWVSNDSLPDYLRTSDIYVSTSLSDGGIASSTAEAMACGLPIVITDFGDNRKWIEDGENGFIVPTKNPEFLAKKIIYLLKNEDVRKKIGEQGRKTIKERNDYRVEMSKMEEIYKELANLKL